VPRSHHRLAQTEEPNDGATPPRLVLELYIAGTMPRSVQAVSAVKQICQRFFKDRSALKVFDLTRNPQLAVLKQILAVPTLIKVEPAPERRFIGDFADAERMAAALSAPTPSKVI
jgi:circadian clock protein KaiB